MEPRRFLIYCAVGGLDWKPDLFGPGRRFDVALNNYKGVALDTPAEYFFTERTQKLLGAYRNIPKIPAAYEAYAVLDDDIEASVEELNRLFELGVGRGLRHWQPALTAESFASHPWTRQAPGCGLRKYPKLEMMAPFFSREALEKCLPSFGDTLGGWGVDTIAWPALLERRGIYIIDSIPVRHMRPVQSSALKLSHGLTPAQEVGLMFRDYASLWIRLKNRLKCLIGNPDGRAFSFGMLPAPTPRAVSSEGREKAEQIARAIEERPGELLFFSETPVNGYPELAMKLFTSIEGRELAFTPGFVCLVVRAGPRTAAFWREAGLAEDARRLLDGPYRDLRWGLLPEAFPGRAR